MEKNDNVAALIRVSKGKKTTVQVYDTTDGIVTIRIDNKTKKREIFIPIKMSTYNYIKFRRDIGLWMK